jgi:hypothetical protein
LIFLFVSLIIHSNEILFLFVILICNTLLMLAAPSKPLKPISQDEAYNQIHVLESARKKAEATYKEQLIAAPAEETTVRFKQNRKIIYNRLSAKKPDNSRKRKPSSVESTRSQSGLLPVRNENPGQSSKPNHHLTLSGRVYPDGLSELWWSNRGQSFRIFTNADCGILKPMATYEDEHSRYTTFLAISAASTDLPATDKDRLNSKIEDFAMDGVKYWITEWGDKAEPDIRDFAGIEAMLNHYAQNKASLHTAKRIIRKCYRPEKNTKGGIHPGNVKPSLTSGPSIQTKSNNHPKIAPHGQVPLKKMKTAKIAVTFILTLAILRAVPTADDFNCGLNAQGEPNCSTSEISWFAKKDHYYFLKQSEDLTSRDWDYFPYAVKGSDAPVGLEVETNSEKMFFRVVHTNDLANELLKKDFDGDKVINLHELDKGYNLYDNSDTDSDTLPDDWERHYFEKLDHDHEDDVDGDGFSNAIEFLFDTDPSLNYANEAVRLAVDTRIRNRNPTEALKIFSEQDHANATYVRNPNCWGQDIEDITAISPWNSRQGRHRAGTLISPRHIIHAAHYPLYTNDKVRFIDEKQ